MTITNNNTIPNELLRWMDCIEYGWMDKSYKKYFTFDTWWEDYRLLLPPDVKKYKIGTCYEQALLAYDHLTSHGYKCKLIYIQQYKISTHLFVIYKVDGGWNYFEHSFEKYKGISGPYKNIIDIVNLVHSNMAQYSLKYQKLRDQGFSWRELDRSKFNKRLTGPESYKIMKYDWSKQEK